MIKHVASLFVCLLGACSALERSLDTSAVEEAIVEKHRKRIRTAVERNRGETAEVAAIRLEPELDVRAASVRSLARAIENDNAFASSEARVTPEGRKASAELEARIDELAQEQSKPEVEGLQNFKGLNFGIAPAITFGGKKSVKSAKIDSSSGTPVVRVTDENDDRAALLIETHYFFPAGERIGVGPFMALQSGENDVIDGLGFGLMMGFRYDEKNRAGRSFNIGIGQFLDNNVQVLGRGFSDGGPPPTGATEVQFREEDVWRNVLLFSFTFSF